MKWEMGTGEINVLTYKMVGNPETSTLAFAPAVLGFVG